jgi:sortase A
VAGEFQLGATPPGPLSGGRTRRSSSARAVRVLAIALIVLGALALIDGAVTLLWQEPISALYAKIRQDDLSGALKRIEHAAPSPMERRTLASLTDERNRIAFLAGELEHHTGDGSPLGRIVIPRVGASYVVVKGADTESLKSGPGVYPETRFPGIPGTTAIAGHRTTYLAPFRDINLLVPGNRILLNMPYAHFTYTVIGHRVVSPSDVQAAVANVSYSRVVLSACTPLFSAAKRLLVYARLTRTVPVGDARLLPGNARPQPIDAQSVAASSRPAQTRLQGVLESLDPNSVAPLV